MQTVCDQVRLQSAANEHRLAAVLPVVGQHRLRRVEGDTDSLKGEAVREAAEAHDLNGIH